MKNTCYVVQSHTRRLNGVAQPIIYEEQMVMTEAKGQPMRLDELYDNVQILITHPSGPGGYDPVVLNTTMRRSLAQMQPGDGLLLVGSPAAIAMAFTWADDYTRGQFRYLEWDKRATRGGAYVLHPYHRHQKGPMQDGEEGKDQAVFG